MSPQCPNFKIQKHALCKRSIFGDTLVLYAAHSFIVAGPLSAAIVTLPPESLSFLLVMASRNDMCVSAVKIDFSLSLSLGLARIPFLSENPTSPPFLSFFLAQRTMQKRRKASIVSLLRVLPPKARWSEVYSISLPPFEASLGCAREWQFIESTKPGWMVGLARRITKAVPPDEGGRGGFWQAVNNGQNTSNSSAWRTWIPCCSVFHPSSIPPSEIRILISTPYFCTTTIDLARSVFDFAAYCTRVVRTLTQATGYKYRYSCRTTTPCVQHTSLKQRQDTEHTQRSEPSLIFRE